MRKLLALIGVLVFLAACAPVQEGVERAVRAVGAGDDGAQLIIHDAGVTFDAGGALALDTVLYVGGEALSAPDEECEPLGNGIACYLGDVEAEATVAVTGVDLSANVSYYREEQASPLFFYVRE